MLTTKDHILQGLFTIAVGYLFTNLVAGGLAGSITRKLVFGDWDYGFQWSVKDIWFWSISFLQGAFGSYLRLGISR
jgi:hypothetical protein